MTDTGFSTNGGITYTYVNIEGILTRDIVNQYSRQNLTNVIIGTGVTSIGSGAFAHCMLLTSITIPNSVNSIGTEAFSSCISLARITIPNSVTRIGSDTFANCTSLTSITIPDSVTSIGINAFYFCTSLTSITIPDSVTSIGDSAFYFCTSLSIMTFEGGYSTGKTVGSNLFIGISPNGERKFYLLNTTESSQINNSLLDQIKFITYDDRVSVTGPQIFTIPITYTGFSIDRGLNYTYVNIEGELTRTIVINNRGSDLTNVIVGSNVTSIGAYAFVECSNLTQIIIPNSVTSISEAMLYLCTSLTSITIPNSVTSIGVNALRKCSSLTSITIPNSVTSIGNSAFYECTSLSSITIPNFVTSIGAEAFRKCTKLVSITIPNSVTSIGNTAFERCSSLTSITIPNYVTSIGDGMFSGCSSLTSITIPNSVTSIDAQAFRVCTSLVSITIPNSVTSIGNAAFYECTSLSSITIPNYVTSIGAEAFRKCTKLASITITNSVTSIGNGAFGSCSLLSIMTFEGGYSTGKTVGSNLFTDIESNSTRKFYFGNTTDANQIDTSLLGQIQEITVNSIPSVTGPQIYLGIIPPIETTVITVNANFESTFGNVPFYLNARSTSTAPFSYLSDDTRIVTVQSVGPDGNGLVTIVGPGETTITISQEAVEGFTEASTTTNIHILANNEENPATIQNSEELQYFMTTDAQYGNISQNIYVYSNIINRSTINKSLINYSETTPISLYYSNIG